MDLSQALENFKLKSPGHKALSVVMILLSIVFLLGFFIKCIPSGDFVRIIGTLVITGTVVYFTIKDLTEAPKEPEK